MKIVKMKGGLGNQLFQYMFALYLKEQFKEEVYLDFSYYKHCTDDIRKPRIMEYNLLLSEVPEQKIKKYLKFKQIGNFNSLIYKSSIFFEKNFNRRYFFEEKNKRNFQYIEDIKEFIYYDGYWQNWKYVDYISKKNLFPTINKNHSNFLREKKNLLISQKSVFVGIRRGDYITNKKNLNRFSSCSNNYYLSAMRRIQEKLIDPVFYIFSNDMEWVKRNLTFDTYNFKFWESDEILTDFEEFSIMQSCNNAIISNSTFHYWVAQFIMNKDKIIIAPKYWFANGQKTDIIPPNWIQIDNL